MTESGASRPATLPVVPAISSVCPYLLAAGGGWRASTPAREHRCTAVAPSAVLAAEKQRRLCLVAEHRGCSTYAAASGVGGIDAEPPAHGRRRAGRPVTRTTPLVLDHGRLAISMPAIRPERGVGQGGLVALMAVAFGAIVIARLSGGPPVLGPAQVVGAGSASPSAVATDGASTAPAATPHGVPDRTLVPTEVDPTQPPPASDVTEATPGVPAARETYIVRSGDTLSGIAGQFGTTWQVLAELNGIEDPGRLRVDQVLELP